MNAMTSPTKTLVLMVILAAVMAVAVADIFLKRASATGSFSRAISSPWMIGAIALYIFQIGIFTWAFVNKWPLTIIGNLQTVFYALIIILGGLIIFHEHLKAVQWVGVTLAIVAVVLLNA